MCEVCPSKILEVGPDEFDLFREEPVMFVKHDERKKVRYSCAECRPGFGAKRPPVLLRASQEPSLTPTDGRFFTGVNEFGRVQTSAK